MIVERHAKDLLVGDMVAGHFRQPYAVTHITHGRSNVYVRFAEAGKVTYKANQHVLVEIEDPEAGWHDCKCPLCGHEAVHSDKDDKTYCYREECINYGD